MATVRPLEFLSEHLAVFLGDDYQLLSKAYTGLRTKEGLPALEKDEHRAHLAVLSTLIREDEPPLVIDMIRSVLEKCLPIYHPQYEVNRKDSICTALSIVETTMMQLRKSDWSRRDLAVAELICIQKGYMAALEQGVDTIQTRVPVTILEEGPYSLDVKTAFFCAVEYGEIKTIEYFLLYYPEQDLLNKENEEGKTVLFYVVDNDKSEVLQWLLKLYPDKILEILFYSISKDKKNIVENLLSNFPDQDLLNKTDETGKTILLFSVDNDKLWILRRLLPYCPDKIPDIFFYAVSKGKVKIVEHLLSRYPERDLLKKTNGEGKTALLYALLNDQLEMFIYLFSYHPNCSNYPNKASDCNKLNNFQKALFWVVANDRVVANDQIKMLDYLLSHYSIQISLSDTLSEVLFCAISNDKLKVVEYLLCDLLRHRLLKQIEGEDGMKFLLYAIDNDKLEIFEYLLWYFYSNIPKIFFYAVSKGKVQIVEHLLFRYPEQDLLKKTDNEGRTALFCAVDNDKLTVFKLLLEKDSLDEASKINKIYELFFYAVSKNKVQIVDHLLSMYPEQELLKKTDGEGKTALLRALSNEQLEMLACLLSYYPHRFRFRYEYEDEIPKKVLFLAAANGQIEVLDYLLSHYPDQVSLSEKDNTGRTLLMIATENKEEEMRAYLLAKYPEQWAVAEPIQSSSSPVPRLSSSPFAFNARPVSPTIESDSIAIFALDTEGPRIYNQNKA